MHQSSYFACSVNVNCLRMCSTKTDRCNSTCSYAHFPHKPLCWSFVCIICLAVIECGSKKAVRKTQGCGMMAVQRAEVISLAANSTPSFVSHRLRCWQLLCQPQSIMQLMNLNRSQLPC